MKPRIAAATAAALTAQIPSRLVKKLDADPAMAERWTWAEAAGTWTVTTDKGEVVTIRPPDDVRCSCLLQPKCLHVAAVLAVLEPDDSAPAAAPAPVALAPAAAIDTRAAARAFAACAEVLATGAEATGAFAQAELLRSIHACRTDGLHRLAAAQTRVLRSVRELRADRPEASLSLLAGDLREALAVSYALSHGDAHATLVGTARRDYEPAGNLRLFGLFTEAIVARTGYAGAVTYLVDEAGVLYTRADVAPGDVGRAAGAYDAAAGIGDAVLPHRELCRAGLFVSDATASADGRLGAGAKVRAVRASEPSHWDHAVLAVRWQRPLAEQLARIADHDATPDDLRPAGWDLVFVEGVIVGSGGAVALAIGSTLVHVTTSHDHRMLQGRDNLAVLERATGLAVRAIGRVRLHTPRRLELLALGPAAGETRLALPDAWYGRANLHYDRLSVPALGAAPISLESPPADDLLEPLRRRVERVALGGVGTLPVHALPELLRDAALLADRALGGGAEALRDLAAFAHDAERTFTGERRAVDRSTFARVWLRAALYDAAARRRLSAASW